MQAMVTALSGCDCPWPRVPPSSGRSCSVPAPFSPLTPRSRLVLAPFPLFPPISWLVAAVLDLSPPLSPHSRNVPSPFPSIPPRSRRSRAVPAVPATFLACSHPDLAPNPILLNDIILCTHYIYLLSCCPILYNIIMLYHTIP